MKKEELKQLFETAKKLGIAISKWSDAERYFDRVTINELGEIGVHFSEYFREDMETDEVWLHEEDFLDPFDIVVESRKEEIKKKQELERQRELDRIDKARKEANKEKERQELETYNRLRLKFEGSEK